MPAKKADRRVLRTRELLLDAFVALMIERGFEKLTVQHLLDQAGVGRATFYAHFRSKEDLLASSIARLETGLRHAWKSTATSRAKPAETLGFALPFFQHIDSHRSIYYLNVGRAGHATVEQHLHRRLVDLVREDLLSQRGTRGKSVATEAVVQYVAGAMWSLGIWWIGSRAHLSPEELTALFRKLVFPGLSATLPAASLNVRT